MRYARDMRRAGTCANPNCACATYLVSKYRYSVADMAIQSDKTMTPPKLALSPLLSLGALSSPQFLTGGEEQLLRYDNDIISTPH